MSRQGKRGRLFLTKVLLGILGVSFALLSSAQYTPTSTPPQPPPADDQLDTQAVQQAIEQMEQMIRSGIGSATGVEPTFDGKNLIFRINGQVYTFDITGEARKTTEALTTLEVTPETPRAHETAEVRVKNFSTNLLEDRITWTVNGSVVQDQIGGTSIRIPMGGIGEGTRIIVTVFSRKLGEVFSKELILTPGDVAILWEAHTYIPPFYKGKPLPSYRSTVKLVPLPTMISGNRQIPPEQLLYQWSRNYRNIESLSGYGKQSSFFETGSGLQQERLKLKVRHPDTGGETEREIVIEVVNPKILLYAGSPLQGTRYEEALEGTLTLTTQETSIKGEPYFVSMEEMDAGIAPVGWTQNGKSIPSLYRSVTLQKPTTGGTSRIEASFANPNKILQSARAGITIRYQGN